MAAVGRWQPGDEIRSMTLEYGLCLTVQAHSQQHMSAGDGAGDKQCPTVLSPIKVEDPGQTLYLDFLDQLATNGENLDAVLSGQNCNMRSVRRKNYAMIWWVVIQRESHDLSAKPFHRIEIRENNRFAASDP